MWVWKAVKKGFVCFRSLNLSQNTCESVEHYYCLKFFKLPKSLFKTNHIVQINDTIAICGDVNCKGRVEIKLLLLKKTIMS